MLVEFPAGRVSTGTRLTIAGIEPRVFKTRFWDPRSDSVYAQKDKKVKENAKGAGSLTRRSLISGIKKLSHFEAGQRHRSRREPVPGKEEREASSSERRQDTKNISSSRDEMRNFRTSCAKAEENSPMVFSPITMLRLPRYPEIRFRDGFSDSWFVDYRTREASSNTETVAIL